MFQPKTQDHKISKFKETLARIVGSMAISYKKRTVYSNITLAKVRRVQTGTLRHNERKVNKAETERNSKGIETGSGE